MFNSVGPLEIIIVLVIVLLIFGPKRLPGLGKSLGTGMREFKESITSRHDKDDDEETPAVPERATLARAEEPVVREGETTTPAPTAEPRS
jgi:sec-independent protein translocase protein TatA